MNKIITLVIGGGAIVALIIAGTVLFLDSDSVSNQPVLEDSTEISQTVEPSSLDPQGESSAVIAYDNNGYSPKNITIKKGQTVKFTTASDIPNWVASNPHPSHVDYPEFDTGVILDTLPAPGDETEFTFTKVGTWGFHNHNQQSDTGSVTVTE